MSDRRIQRHQGYLWFLTWAEIDGVLFLSPNTGEEWIIVCVLVIQGVINSLSGLCEVLCPGLLYTAKYLSVEWMHGSTFTDNSVLTRSSSA